MNVDTAVVLIKLDWKFESSLSSQLMFQTFTATTLQKKTKLKVIKKDVMLHPTFKFKELNNFGIVFILVIHSAVNLLK